MIENIRLSFKGIVSHKMRSVLTMLGIIIGIAAVIIIVTIIQGTTQSLKDQFVGGDTNNIQLNLYDSNDPFAYEPYDTGMYGTIPGITTISQESVDEVNQIDGVVNATPAYYKNYSVPLSYNGKSSNCSGYGVEKDFFDTKDLIVSSGRLFNERDYEDKNNVIILSSTVANQLFSNESALGKTVNINNDMFVVVGVVTQIKDYSDVNNFNDYYVKVGIVSNDVYVPRTAWHLIGGYDDIQSLIIKISDIDATVNIATIAAQILNDQIMSDKYNYKSSSINEDTESLETIADIASILLVGIASISLLVGGIGVMNIMLVSVTERTREIGLKKALGAKRKVILSQFLTESVVLTSVGGIIGVLIGIGAAYIITAVISLPMSISVPAILISVGFSMGVGIIFGLVPSIKAAKLDPIEALRYE